MTNFIINKLPYDLTSNAGLALVSLYFKRIGLARLVEAKFPLRAKGVSNSSGDSPTKAWTCSIWLALILATGAAAQAQTFDEAMAAFRQGNYAVAIAGFRKAADQGNANAQYNLGMTYANGQGVPKDDQQAVFC